MEETDKVKWASCQTWMGNRCPHQEIINEAALLKEKKDDKKVEVFKSNILEEAYSCCEKCDKYKRE